MSLVLLWGAAIGVALAAPTPFDTPQACIDSCPLPATPTEIDGDDMGQGDRDSSEREPEAAPLDARVSVREGGCIPEPREPRPRPEPHCPHPDPGTCDPVREVLACTFDNVCMPGEFDPACQGELYPYGYCEWPAHRCPPYPVI